MATDQPAGQAIQLQSVNFSSVVAGPGAARIGWVLGPHADAIAYLPELGVVAIRLRRSETLHPLAVVTRMVAAVPVLPPREDS